MQISNLQSTEGNTESVGSGTVFNHTSICAKSVPHTYIDLRKHTILHTYLGGASLEEATRAIRAVGALSRALPARLREADMPLLAVCRRWN
jgi:alanine dehydrogenase